MTTTLSKGQEDLANLVEIASRGEDVVITVEGKPKARLTRVETDVGNGKDKSLDLAAWLGELEQVRQQYATGKPGLSTDQIVAEDRAGRL